MRTLGPSLLLAIGAVLAAPAACSTVSTPEPPRDAASPAAERIVLPSVAPAGALRLEDALAARRSVRDFTAQWLTPAEVGRLCWAAQGITGSGGGRTTPSAGALYPLRLHVLTADGVFRYLPELHALERVAAGDRRPALGAAAGGQDAVANAPAVIAITADPSRVEAKYADRALRYIWLEAGHAAQNVLLEAVALGLGGVPIGAFDDRRVLDALEQPAGILAVYLLPVGHPA